MNGIILNITYKSGNSVRLAVKNFSVITGTNGITDAEWQYFDERELKRVHKMYPDVMTKVLHINVDNIESLTYRSL